MTPHEIQSAIRGNEQPMAGSERPAPDVEHYLRSISDRPAIPLDKSGIRTLRQRYRKPPNAKKLPIVQVGEILADSVAGRTGSIAMRRYLPIDRQSGAQPAILFFHGGGWVAGDLDSHDEICRHMVRLTGLQLVSVDYRVAPEHPFPAAVDDAIDSYAMLLQRAVEWDIDPKRIAVMGDGTGGTLASVVSIHAREMCHPIPTAQLLFYPVTDLAAESRSFQANDGSTSLQSARALRWLHTQYIRQPGAAAGWRASPLRAQSMAGMPPSFIAVGKLDPLFDEAVAFADRLYKAGCTVHLRALPGQIHGYLSIGGTIGEALRSLEAAAIFLKPLTILPTLPRQNHRV